MPSSNLAVCPHPKSQQTVLSRLRGAVQYLCNTCGLVHWIEEK